MVEWDGPSYNVYDARHVQQMRRNIRVTRSLIFFRHGSICLQPGQRHPREDGQIWPTDERHAGPITLMRLRQ